MPDGRIHVRLRLPYREPFTFRPMLASLAAHAVPGLESASPEQLCHTRIVEARSGPALVTVSFASPGQLVAEVDLPSEGDAPGVTALLRHWLDLDADTEAIDAHLARSELLSGYVAARPGLRVLRSTNGFETAVMAVLGQQVSLAAARTFGGRLVAGYGAPAVQGYRSFPTAEAIAQADPGELQARVGVTHSRAGTLHALARAVRDGLPLHGAADRGEARQRLLELPGIGPWTADYLALRVFGDPDAYAAGDLILKRALGVKTAAQAVAVAGQWRPWRSYAQVHLWTSDFFA